MISENPLEDIKTKALLVFIRATLEQNFSEVEKFKELFLESIKK